MTPFFHQGASRFVSVSIVGERGCDVGEVDMIGSDFRAVYLGGWMVVKLGSMCGVFAFYDDRDSTFGLHQLTTISKCVD